MHLLLILIFMLHGLFANSEVIEFPDEELARESVNPVFDKVSVVKNRNIVFAKRFEFFVAGGVDLSEALYNKNSLSLGLWYNFDNNQSVSLSYAHQLQGLSNNALSLKNGEGQLVGETFDPSLAPQKQSYIIANYNFNAYYGKISLSKDYVANLSLYGTIGAVMVNYDDESVFGLNLGIGQKFFLTKNLALKFDLNMMAYSGLDPTSVDLETGGSKRSSSDFSKTTHLPIFFGFGLVYLL